MKRVLSRFTRLSLMAAALVAVAQAQVEVLSPQQIAAFQGRLAQGATPMPAAFSQYVQDLQRRQGGAGEARPASPLARELANAARVSEGIAGQRVDSGALLVHAVVPAMSPVMRLPDAFPADGRFLGEVGIVAAQDEYEPGSFVLYAFRDLDGVELKLTDLKSADGAVYPKENLDLKVVKVWYQNGNGWFSYFQDPGHVLVPELLLHDENLIKVDTARQANYARVNRQKGAQYIWISQPRELAVPFDPYDPGFVDAPAMQPVSLPAGQFKQFFLTAHVPTKTKPGTYRGSIEVTTGGKALATIPVAVGVLPFELPAPKANYDINKDYIVTLMGAWPRVAPEHKAFMPTLLNLRRHNILHLGPDATPNTPADEAAKRVKAMKDAGFYTNFILNGGLPWRGTHDGTPYSFDDMVEFQRSAKAWREFYMKYFGHTNAAVGLGDEQGAAWVMKARRAWRILQEQGLKTNLAGHEHIFFKGGYMLDVNPAAGSPDEADKARLRREVGNAHVGFYASQHTGSENPAFVRRQHGLLGYLSDFDMINNYEFAYGPWNDWETELYKPMVVAYPSGDGLVDTLQWEGFREGVDDIRYATKLRQLAAEAIASGDLDRIYAGRRVAHWFVLLDGFGTDLNAARMEMIQKTLELIDLSKKTHN